MASRAELESLRERVLAASGPDREIDALVWCLREGARFREGYMSSFDFCYEQPMDGMWIRGVKRLCDTPKFTASIDAATALAARMLPEAFIEINGPRKYLNIPTPVPNVWKAEVDCVKGWGFTAPLALLAALLSALITIQEQGA